MDTMNYVGTGTFSGKFYQGSVKKYTLELASTEPVTWFFYYTTPDGHPVCQGEGGDAPDSQKGRGIFVWHEYNVTSFNLTVHHLHLRVSQLKLAEATRRMVCKYFGCTHRAAMSVSIVAVLTSSCAVLCTLNCNMRCRGFIMKF